MAYMEEISDYKKEIKRAIWESQAIKDLIANETNTQMPIEELEQFVIPFGRHPETITSQGTYVLFEIDPTKAKHKTIMDYTLRLWVMSHDAINLTPKGVRVDRLVSELDKVLSNNRNFGIGSLESGGAPTFVTSKGFSGRVMVYYAQDFRGVE